jgi:glycosyltransferase involved in cell wall biosynthesis
MGRTPMPQNLNICLITRKFSTRGRAAENSFLWPISRGIAKRGHRIVVISTSGPEKKAFTNDQGVEVHYVHEIGSPLARLDFAEAVKRKFLELEKDKPFHIIHAIDSSVKRIAKDKKRLKFAIALDTRATQMSQIFAIMGMVQETVRSQLLTAVAVSYKFLRTYFGSDRKLLSYADGVFATSPRQRIVLERYYMYPEMHIHTVPYGIEVGDLSPKEKSDELRESLKIPPDGHVAVTITDMTEINELKNILRAFEIVAIKKPKSRLIIVGNGPNRKAVEKEMYDLALGSKVKLVGAVPATEISDYISLADVFIDISVRSTGFEPPMLEAMAQRKVIVGSELGAISSVVEDGVDGFLIRPADIEALSNLLLDIFTGRLQTLEIGDRARRKILNLFDLDKMVDETLKSYYKILNRTGYYRKN